MYKNNNTVISFYYPNAVNIAPDQLGSKIMDDIKRDGNENFLGYLSLDMFKEDLSFRLGEKKIDLIQLDEELKNQITKCILEVQAEFEKELELVYKPVRFFIFPWFPTASESKNFEGVAAAATYFTVMHIFIDLEHFSIKSLRETLVHELNHLYFFQIHNNIDLTIKEKMVLEGLAENFREYLVGGEVAPWAKNLESDEIKKTLEKVSEFYNSKDINIYHDIFFGSEVFKRWTGYSLGYFLVKKYITQNKNANWKKVMALSVDIFYQGS